MFVYAAAASAFAARLRSAKTDLPPRAGTQMQLLVNGVIYNMTGEKDMLPSR